MSFLAVPFLSSAIIWWAPIFSILGVCHASFFKVLYFQIALWGAFYVGCYLYWVPLLQLLRQRFRQMCETNFSSIVAGE